MGTRKLTVRRLRAPDALETLGPSWLDLWRRVPQATPFQSPGWLIPWWQRFGCGELYVVAVSDEDRLAALAPCFVADGQLRTIGLAVSDYLDILVDPAYPQAAASIAASFAEFVDWDIVTFSDLAPDSTLLGLPCPAGVRDAQWVTDPCPVLSLGDGDFRAALPRRMRRNLANAWACADRLGPIAVATGPEMFDRLVALHRARWTGQGGGMLNEAAVLAFHRAALPPLAAQGLLRLYGIAIAGRIVAAYYGFLHGDRAYGYLTGFDPSVEGQSLGTIVIGHALSEAAREGAKEFHFLRGGEGYKYAWGARDRPNRSRQWSRP